MNKYAILFALSLSLLLPACDKDDPHDPDPTPKKVLDFIENTFYQDTLFYEFNSAGQIIRQEVTNDERVTVDVNGNQLHIVEYRIYESRTVADVTFTLNAAGNIATGQGNISYNMGSPYTADYTYTYNNDGYLTERTDVRSNGDKWTYKYYWTNGDLTKWEWLQKDTLYLTFDFEYEGSIPDKIQLDYNKLSFLGNTSWTGKSSAHLVTRNSRFFAPSTTYAYDYTYDYTLDPDGYVTSYIIGDNIGTFADSVVYHYK